MNIVVIGTGYVGLVTGAGFSEMGNNVTCVDSDEAKIKSIHAGRLPIYEPGLDELVSRNAKEGRLRFTSRLTEAMTGAHVFVIAVGTPSKEDGSADLGHVLAVARELGCNLKEQATIVNKSTVPIGTVTRVRAAIEEELQKRGVKVDFDVVSNPEFLKQGDAVADFLRPDRVIVGVESDRAAELMKILYGPFIRNHERLLVMKPRDSEMTKYAANSMLATKISFMNEIANLCEVTGVDVENVRKGIGWDARIGYAFIYPGCGFGGSCLPKDVKALIQMAKNSGFEPSLLQAVDSRNQAQKGVLFEKVSKRFGGKLSGLTFGVWGLAFKPGTDDMREAPSAVLLSKLLAAGAKVRAYDPAAGDVARRTLPRKWFDDGSLSLCEHQYDAVKGVTAMILVTDWKPFRNPDFAVMKKTMQKMIIFDGRNQYDPKQMAVEGFEYHGIGREVANAQLGSSTGA
jgi:UDPglucose 6-dehydrogenase